MTNPITKALSNPDFRINTDQRNHFERAKSDSKLRKIPNPLSSPRRNSPRNNDSTIPAPSSAFNTQLITLCCGDFYLNMFYGTLIKKAPGLAVEADLGKTLQLEEFFSTHHLQAAFFAINFLSDNPIYWNRVDENGIYVAIRTLRSSELLSLFVLHFGCSDGNLLKILSLLALIPNRDVFQTCSKFIDGSLNHLDAGYLERLYDACVQIQAHVEQIKILKYIKNKNLIDEIQSAELKGGYSELAQYLSFIECDCEALTIEGAGRQAPDALAKLKTAIFSQKSNVRVFLSLRKKCSSQNIDNFCAHLKDPECIVTHIYITAFNYTAGEDIKQLIESLKNNTSVVSLRINGRIGRMIAPCLKKTVKQRKKALDLDLDLSFTNLNEGADHIGKLCQKKALKKLNLSCSGLTDLSLREFSKFSITFLDLSCNQLGEAGAQKLFKGLQKTNTLRHIDLSATGLSNKGVHIILQALSSYHRVTTMCLNSNKIDDSGCLDIRYYLSQNRGLKNMELKANKIEDWGASMIALALLKNTSLYSLDLSQNLIRERGAITLSRALKRNKNIVNLSLDGNRIGRKGVQSLKNVLNSPLRTNLSHS